MSRIEEAVQYLLHSSACSQAILSAYAPCVGLDKRLAHKLGTGLGAGFGRKQYICGAISAGAIILSLLYGSEVSEDKENKSIAYEHVYNYITDMEQKLGYVDCAALIGVDLSTEEGRQQAKEQRLTELICSNYIRTVATYLENHV